MSKKALLAGYEHDIFVSYAHEDQLGVWSVVLQEDLRKALNLILLSKLKGRYIDIWIDEALRNNLPLTEQLERCVANSALLLIIMSPFYLGSAWCGKEVSWFSAAARSRIAPSRRIFIVHALPTDRASWPSTLSGLTPYSFFGRHLKTKVELPFGLIGDDEDKATYKAVLYNLAGQIREQIEELLAESDASLPATSLIASPSKVPERNLQTAFRRMVWFEIAGSSTNAAEVETEVRGVLNARHVDVVSPAKPSPVARDPLLTDKLLQKILKAKAACDGLLLLRLDNGTSIDDWLLDYLSEVRPMSARLRADGHAPPPLLIDADSNSNPIGEVLPTLRFDAPDFSHRLTDWIDRLPVLGKAAP
jgi:hypothetical protein